MSTPLGDRKAEPVREGFSVTCKQCGSTMAEVLAAYEPIATVIDNNQAGWTNVIETKPNVTLLVGTKLYIGPAVLTRYHTRPPAQQSSAESGMVLVPREPTDAMICAARTCGIWADDGRHKNTVRSELNNIARKLYAAMISAAESAAKQDAAGQTQNDLELASARIQESVPAAPTTQAEATPETEAAIKHYKYDVDDGNYEYQFAYVLPEDMAAVERQRNALQAKLAAVEKDAERYRWLREHAKHYIEFDCDEEGTQTRGQIWGQIPESTDAAIDAAIAAEKEGK